MDKLQIFKNSEFGEVRVIKIENKHWFIGKDVVEALGYDLKTHSYTKYINKYVSPKGQLLLNKETQSSVGIEFDYKILGQRGGILLNEGGLNQLALSSPLPDAQEFQEWICYEVLPILNHTGGYVMEGNELEFVQKYFPSFSNEVQLSMVTDLMKQNKEFKKKATWFDDFMNSKGTYSSTQIGKLFKIGSGQKMNKLLHENKIIFKQGKNWIPYETVDKTWYNLNVGTKNEHSYSQLKFTPKGIYELSKLLNIEFNEEDLKELA